MHTLRRTHRILCTALTLLPLSATAQQPGGNVPAPQDLLAVLTLRGKPCGRVVAHERSGESDYLVTCSDGHRYRVHVNAEGRLVVEERSR